MKIKQKLTSKHVLYGRWYWSLEKSLSKATKTTQNVLTIILFMWWFGMIKFIENCW